MNQKIKRMVKYLLLLVQVLAVVIALQSCFNNCLEYVMGEYRSNQLIYVLFKNSFISSAIGIIIIFFLLKNKDNLSNNIDKTASLLFASFYMIGESFEQVGTFIELFRGKTRCIIIMLSIYGLYKVVLAFIICIKT